MSGTDDLELACKLVDAVQAQNTRAGSKRTYHLVISLDPSDRRLERTELERVVDRLVDTLGFSEHQYIAVRHDDADHEHIHVAINKIRPETLRIHSPAWDHRKLFTGARALELELGSTPLRSRVRDRENVPQRAAGCEAHHGIESFARWARENLGPALRAIEVRSWDDLHGICGEFGVVIRPRGNGLVFEEYEQSLHHARAQRGPMARSPHLEASCATPDRARFNEDACRLTIAAWLTCLLRGGAQHRGSGPVRGQF